MQYQAIIHPISQGDNSCNGIATVREANGTTDKEWRLKCRILMTENTRRQALIDELHRMNYIVLDADAWKEYINLDGEDDVPNNFFVSTEVVYDKWDSVPTIY